MILSLAILRYVARQLICKGFFFDLNFLFNASESHSTFPFQNTFFMKLKLLKSRCRLFTVNSWPNMFMFMGKFFSFAVNVRDLTCTVLHYFTCERCDCTH